WAPYPRISKMKRVAIAADIFSTPTRLAQRHQTGINVVYSDGSAVWVDRKALTNDLPAYVFMYGWYKPGQQIRTNITAGSFEKLGDSFGSAKNINPIMQGIWQMLDKR